MPGVLHIGQLTIKSFLLITDDRKLKNEWLLIVNYSVLFPKTSFSCRLDIARRGCHTGALNYFSLVYLKKHGAIQKVSYAKC